MFLKISVSFDNSGKWILFTCISKARSSGWNKVLLSQFNPYNLKKKATKVIKIKNVYPLKKIFLSNLYKNLKTYINLKLMNKFYL